MKINMDEMQPIFYGSTTVSERGQVVIPAEARKDMDIRPATKFLVIGGPRKDIIILAKTEHLAEFMVKMTDMLNKVKEQI